MHDSSVMNENFYADTEFFDEELSRNMLSLLENRKYCEMSDFENCFLFSLLKKHSPKKILEIGVAAGATTYMLLSYLKDNLPDTKMYSVDYEIKYYRDNSKESGFLATQAFSDFCNWKLFLGNPYPVFCDTIGGDIDFCILDTVHALPGELLDFIAILPFLKDGAIVILHDVSLSLRFIDDLSRYSYNAHATKLLFDVAKGEKIICHDPTRYGMTNIAAIIVNNETRKHVNDLFSALAFTWFYSPHPRDIDIYARHYKENYGIKYKDYFMSLIEPHQKMINASYAYINSLKKNNNIHDKLILEKLSSLENYIIKYPKWIINLLACFIPNRKNRHHLRMKYSR